MGLLQEEVEVETPLEAVEVVGEFLLEAEEVESAEEVVEYIRKLQSLLLLIYLL